MWWVLWDYPVLDMIANVTSFGWLWDMVKSLQWQVENTTIQLLSKGWHNCRNYYYVEHNNADNSSLWHFHLVAFCAKWICLGVGTIIKKSCAGLKIRIRIMQLEILPQFSFLFHCILLLDLASGLFSLYFFSLSFLLWFTLFWGLVLFSHNFLIALLSLNRVD